MPASATGSSASSPTSPPSSLDFYAALLTGIESEAEQLGYDLLLFTSAPVSGGRRSLFHESNRLRLADGCLLLGQEMDGSELERLVESGFPFVAIGRRDAAGVPYVAADYVTGTAELVARSWELGHRRVALLHLDSTGESVLARRGTEPVLLRASDGHDLDADWAALRDSGATVLFVEAPAHALAISRLAEAEGLQIPRDLSIIALADPSRGTEIGPDFTRLSPPRTQLGSEALALLGRILDPRTEVPADELRITLPCAITDGATLAAPRTETTR